MVEAERLKERLVDQISNFPALYSIDANDFLSPESLVPQAKEAWDHVVGSIGESVQNVSTEQLWTMWRNVRRAYVSTRGRNDRNDGEWNERLRFLDPFTPSTSNGSTESSAPGAAPNGSRSLLPQTYAQELKEPLVLSNQVIYVTVRQSCSRKAKSRALQLLLQRDETAQEDDSVLFPIITADLLVEGQPQNDSNENGIVTGAEAPESQATQSSSANNVEPDAETLHPGRPHARTVAADDPETRTQRGPDLTDPLTTETPEELAAKIIRLSASRSPQKRRRRKTVTLDEVCSPTTSRCTRSETNANREHGLNEPLITETEGPDDLAARILQSTSSNINSTDYQPEADIPDSETPPLKRRRRRTVVDDDVDISACIRSKSALYTELNAPEPDASEDMPNNVDRLVDDSQSGIQKSKHRKHVPVHSTSTPKNMELSSFISCYGDGAMMVLLREIRKFRELASVEANGVRSPNELEEGGREAWDKVMRVLNSCYPEADSEQAWTGWKLLRARYLKSKSPGYNGKDYCIKWRHQINFLDEFFVGHENEAISEAIDVEIAPQRRRFPGCNLEEMNGVLQRIQAINTVPSGAQEKAARPARKVASTNIIKPTDLEKLSLKSPHLLREDVRAMREPNQLSVEAYQEWRSIALELSKLYKRVGEVTMWKAWRSYAKNRPPVEPFPNEAEESPSVIEIARTPQQSSSSRSSSDPSISSKRARVRSSGFNASFKEELEKRPILLEFNFKDSALPDMEQWSNDARFAYAALEKSMAARFPWATDLFWSGFLENGRSLQVARESNPPPLQSANPDMTIGEYLSTLHGQRSSTAVLRKRTQMHDYAENYLVERISCHAELYCVDNNAMSGPTCLEEAARAAWQRVMIALQDKFPTVTERDAWSAWRRLRSSYLRNTCPAKWRGRMEFLREGEGGELTPQPTISRSYSRSFCVALVPAQCADQQPPLQYEATLQMAPSFVSPQGVVLQPTFVQETPGPSSSACMPDQTSGQEQPIASASSASSNAYSEQPAEEIPVLADLAPRMLVNRATTVHFAPSTVLNEEASVALERTRQSLSEEPAPSSLTAPSRSSNSLSSSRRSVPPLCPLSTLPDAVCPPPQEAATTTATSPNLTSAADASGQSSSQEAVLPVEPLSAANGLQEANLVAPRLSSTLTNVVAVDPPTQITSPADAALQQLNPAPTNQSAVQFQQYPPQPPYPAVLNPQGVYQPQQYLQFPMQAFFSSGAAPGPSWAPYYLPQPEPPPTITGDDGFKLGLEEIWAQVQQFPNGRRVISELKMDAFKIVQKYERGDM